MNQANISPELSALFTLQRAASSGLASFKTPDGGDTVAAKLAQQGGPQDSNVMGIAQNVQQAGPTIQKNAQNAQAQQVAQQAAGIMQQQQQAQPQPPQGMAHGGIAALPASNMQNFRQGGVLGFSGEKKNNPVPDEKTPAESYPVTEENATPEQRILAQLGRAVSAQDQPEPAADSFSQSPAGTGETISPEAIQATYALLSRGFEGVERQAPAAANKTARMVYDRAVDANASRRLAGTPAAGVARGVEGLAKTRREAPSQSMAYPPEIAATMAETKAMRAQKLPEIADRKALLQEFDKQYKNPSIAQRDSLKGIGGLQEQVLARQQALYEKEKAGRYSEGLGEYLRGAAAGPGRGPAAAAAYDEKVRLREVGRTKEMTDNIEFQKGIVALQNTANKDEHTEMLKRVADTVTDSQKAAELFEKDRAAMLASLRGDLGPQMQAWAKQIHDAEVAKTRADQIRSKEDIAAEANATKLQIAKDKNATARAISNSKLASMGIDRGTDMSRAVEAAIPIVQKENPDAPADQLAYLAHKKVLEDKGSAAAGRLALQKMTAAEQAIAKESISWYGKSPEEIEVKKKEIRDRFGTTPTAAPALPANAVGSLKEGIKTTFGNGQVWTLKDGKPVQVK